MLGLAVDLSTAARVQGHRSDIAILKTARALAALLECRAVEQAHIAEASRMVLPHRMARSGLAPAEGLARRLDELIADVMQGKAAGVEMDPPVAGEDSEDWDETTTQVPGAWAASNTDMVFSFLEEKKKRFLTPMN